MEIFSFISFKAFYKLKIDVSRKVKPHLCKAPIVPERGSYGIGQWQ
jgi:hypothetical protein